MRDPAAVSELATLTVRTCTDRGLTLAVAESLTAGLLGASVASAPGASLMFRGGVIAYATEVKVEVLGVPESVVSGPGVVSAECAEAMAAGVRRLLGSDWGLATTGVAGPELQEGKPVGTVFLGYAGPDGAGAVELGLTGDRGRIRTVACDRALACLLQRLGVDTGPTQ
ncbi:CinA family protein [Nocardioides limicola]|uniref:CinA family protein n=1 Tax=Nocardioides limicola TaxID=2803368 RepID=UPI00193AF9AA|nr:CinA family protein [Nocardioides sp. DJM-14]